MSRAVFTYVLNLIKPNLEKQSNRYGRCTISPDVQLLVALWTMATPDSYRSVCDRFDIGRATAWRANRRVCAAIYSLAPQFIKWPNVEEAEYTWMDVQNKHKFPKVIGAIDGTHIHIHKPKKHAESYINRKGYYSIQLQIICDSTLKFIHCYAGQPGSVHDMRVFRLSGIQSMCTENYFPHDSHLIGDAAYTLQKHVLVPYRNNGHLTAAQINYNTRLSSARVMIERAIGLLKGRFRSLLDKLYMKRTDLIPQYIITCCVLHNICILNNDLIDDVIIIERNNIPEIANDNEITVLDKERGVEKRNALTYMLNER
ncbi:putative nuclease HARBI1 isoform X1 [Linepithema humile]|uniref:putative nuclease HARBI1 isoform X1 n=1 Tax=Linepithema humile TaxID=83485 RepID=UPI00351E0A77